jgi:two-component system response regulator AtoC
MLNGSEPVPHQRSSNPSHFRDAAHVAHDQPALPFSTPFVCVSSTLRRLLLQAEIAAPRLQLAALEGEPGTGKHLFAQTLHHHSDLAHLPFRHCDAREWLANESDLSTLTGSLYLDRVDLLAPIGQGLLLNLAKTLQNEAATPRRLLLLVSAHESLRRLASQGSFLPDLAFRLTAVRFALPPLREHREDIASIAQTLIDSICRRYQQPTAVLAPGTLPRLLQHSWPGNVRELASVLESAILDSTTGVIRPGDLALQIPHEIHPPPHSGTTQLPHPGGDLSLDTAIHRHIQLVLQLNRNNKLRAARQLGISRSTLYRLLAGEPISPQSAQPS